MSFFRQAKKRKKTKRRTTRRFCAFLFFSRRKNFDRRFFFCFQGSKRKRENFLRKDGALFRRFSICFFSRPIKETFFENFFLKKTKFFLRFFFFGPKWAQRTEKSSVSIKRRKDVKSFLFLRTKIDFPMKIFSFSSSERFEPNQRSFSVELRLSDGPAISPRFSIFSATSADRSKNKNWNFFRFQRNFLSRQIHRGSDRTVFFCKKMFRHFRSALSVWVKQNSKLVKHVQQLVQSEKKIEIHFALRAFRVRFSIKIYVESNFPRTNRFHSSSDPIRSKSNSREFMTTRNI